MEAELYRKTISQNLRHIRETRGITTAALAKVLGVSQAKVSYIEHCKGVLSAADVALLSRRLNIPITEFFRGLDAGDSSGAAALVHHLIAYGAVLLAKPAGIVVEPLSFEEVFARSLGFLEDARFEQGFLAALLVQASGREIQIDRIFALIGSNLFLVSKALDELKLADAVIDGLVAQDERVSPRAKRQIHKIRTLAETLLSSENWKDAPVKSAWPREDLSEFVTFAADCLNAAR